MPFGHICPFWYLASLPLLDTTHLDFAQSRGEGQTSAARKAFTVTNTDRTAVLHVGIKTAVPWIEAYPTEFALGPNESQRVVAEMHPERAGDRAIAPATIGLYGQYIAVSAARAGSLPADVSAEITVTPPISDCPTCHATLPEGAAECRRCGERIRLCPICATPNNWIVHRCRTDAKHIIRTEVDWLSIPGGNSEHTGRCADTGGRNLARRWSSPSFPPARATEALEWSAALAAFGMVVASAIDSARERATIYAMALDNGAPLWEIDLPDPSGLYPDRGGMVLSADGTLYAATLSGSLIAVDAIRGTLKWSGTITGPVYGSLTLAGDYVIIPANDMIQAWDRLTGKPAIKHTGGIRYDTAPAAHGATIVCADDGGVVAALSLTPQAVIWETKLEGEFDAAPVIHGDSVIVATLGGEVYSLSLADGATKWRVKATTRQIAAAPAVSADGLIYVGADDGLLHIISADTGHLIRSRRVSDTSIRTAPVVCGHTVFVGADDGSLYTLDTDFNVARAYETTPGARIGCAGITIYGDNLIVPATNGVLYVLRITA